MLSRDLVPHCIQREDCHMMKSWKQWKKEGKKTERRQTEREREREREKS